MLYVERDKDGKIIGLHDKPEPGADEQKPITDAEIIEFLNKGADSDPWLRLLSLSDTGITRILEDLIDLLIKKNIIRFTDLPEEAQAKISERRQLREKMEPNQLMVDDIL